MLHCQQEGRMLLHILVLEEKQGLTVASLASQV